MGGYLSSRPLTGTKNVQTIFCVVASVNVFIDIPQDMALGIASISELPSFVKPISGPVYCMFPHLRRMQGLGKGTAGRCSMALQGRCDSSNSPRR